MRNFSTDYFFEQPLTIINPFKPLDVSATKEAAGLTVQLFPEGGNLVRNLPGKLAFSIVDAAGNARRQKAGC